MATPLVRGRAPSPCFAIGLPDAAIVVSGARNGYLPSVLIFPDGRRAIERSSFALVAMLDEPMNIDRDQRLACVNFVRQLAEHRLANVRLSWPFDVYFANAFMNAPPGGGFR